jgi:hypothetical protein
MGVELLLRIAKHPGNAAVKEARGHMGQILDLLNRKPEGLSVLSGDDALTLPMMVCGGNEAISVTINMFPGEMADMVHRFLEGDTAGAEAVHNRLYHFFVNQFIETNPVPIKTYMEPIRNCAPRCFASRCASCATRTGKFCFRPSPEIARPRPPRRGVSASSSKPPPGHQNNVLLLLMSPLKKGVNGLFIRL